MIGYILLSLPYLLAAGLVAAGANPWASFGAGYVIFIFVMHGFGDDA